MEALIAQLIEQIKKQVLDELQKELRAEVKQPKQFYSLKELSYLTGLSVHAIKGRYRRGTLKVVYDGITPLIPVAEVERLTNKLSKQINK